MIGTGQAERRARWIWHTTPREVKARLEPDSGYDVDLGYADAFPYGKHVLDDNGNPVCHVQCIDLATTRVQEAADRFNDQALVDPEDYASTVWADLERRGDFGPSAIKAKVQEILRGSEPKMWRRFVATDLTLKLAVLRVQQVNPMLEETIKAIEEFRLNHEVEAEADRLMDHVQDKLTECGVELTELEFDSEVF